VKRRPVGGILVRLQLETESNEFGGERDLDPCVLAAGTPRQPRRQPDADFLLPTSFDSGILSIAKLDRVLLTFATEEECIAAFPMWAEV